VHSHRKVQPQKREVEREVCTTTGERFVQPQRGRERGLYNHRRERFVQPQERGGLRER
jgi:hypothetical protein